MKLCADNRTERGGDPAGDANAIPKMRLHHTDRIPKHLHAAFHSVAVIVQGIQCTLRRRQVSACGWGNIAPALHLDAQRLKFDAVIHLKLRPVIIEAFHRFDLNQRHFVRVAVAAVIPRRVKELNPRLNSL